MVNIKFSMKKSDQSFEDSSCQFTDSLRSQEFIPDAAEPPNDRHGPVEGKPYYLLLDGIKMIIIFNFFKVTGENDREGSHRDIENLRKIGNERNFTVEVHENLDKTDFDKEINRIQKDERLKNTSLLMIVVMSHGDGRNAYCFQSSDGESVSMEEVIDRFNDKNCPSLKGKPKIMAGVFCRNTENADSSSRAEAISDKNSNDTAKIYSAKYGEKSYRHEDNGTFLVQALCAALEKHSFTSLRELLSTFHKGWEEHLNPEIKFINFRDVYLC